MYRRSRHVSQVGVLVTSIYPQISPDWRPGPRLFDSLPKQVDVWRLPFGSAGVAADGSDDAPSGDGHNTNARQQIRHAVQDILSRYLGIPADSIRIERDSSGKPHLANEQARLHFNLSHCRDLALLAVSGTHPVGIDVEQTRNIDNLMRIARRALPRRDIEALSEAAPAQQLPLFLDCWTRMEARQKTLGRGIFGSAVHEGDISCATFCPAPGHAASVCTTGAHIQAQIRFFDLLPPA